MTSASSEDLCFRHCAIEDRNMFSSFHCDRLSQSQSALVSAQDYKATRLVFSCPDFS